MYMTLRNMRADLGQMQDALGLLNYVVGRLNSEHGGSFGYSMQVGGDPSALALASPWETLGAYETARASIANDPEMQSAIRMASGLVTDVQDTIGQILVPPGDRGAYAEVNTVRMHMPAAHAAMEFALEVAEYASGKLGRGVGLLSAWTGDRSGLMFVAYGSSLDDLAESSAALEADTEYQGFYKRSEDLMVPGSLERTVWQFLG